MERLYGSCSSQPAFYCHAISYIRAHERKHQAAQEREWKTRRFIGRNYFTTAVSARSARSAGSIAAVITTPVDVVKTRIMLSAAGESSEAKAKEEVEKARKQGQSLNNLASKKGVLKKGWVHYSSRYYG